MTGKSTGGNGGQVKLITLVRVDDVQRWQDAFVERLGGGLPGAQRIVLNIVRPVEVRENAGGIDPFDAVSEGWFDSRAHAEAARDAFAKGTDKAVHLLVDEVLIHDSGIRPLSAKVIVAFRRLPSVTREAAQAHWRGRHVEIGLVENNATDFLRLYFQNHVLADNPVDSPEDDFDGLPEYWLDEGAMASVAEDAPVMQAIAEDEKNFLYKPSLVTMLVEERPVFVA